MAGENIFEKEHAMLMRKLAPECMVMLRKNGDFPLENPCEIALYGSGARRTIKGGTGSGDVNVRSFVNVEKGLENAGFVITTKNWMDAYDLEKIKAKKAFMEEIKRTARKQHTLAVFVGMGAVMPEPEYEIPLEGKGDVAVYVLSRICGEGNDRKAEKGDMLLTETEIRDILECKRKYEKFMLVLNVGGTVDLTPVAEVENILLMSQLGTAMGDAFADVLLGKSYPSGKLTSGWASAKDIPFPEDFGNPDETRYREGIYVGYRYYESAGIKPFYPFGYGLGYTDFSIGKTDFSAEGTEIKIKATVKNIGNFPGKETLQLYVTAPWGKLDQPYIRLAGFAKTKELLPGEETETEISFRFEDIASYDEENASYILEKGDYILRIGTDSHNKEICAVVEIREDITVRKLTNIGGKPDFTDWKPKHSWKDEDTSGVERYVLESEAFGGISFPEKAAVPQRALESVKKLSDEELAKTVIGNFEGGGSLAVIGAASKTVAGAAGESYGKIPGLPSIVMADGPAGLRLSREYIKDEKGVHALGSTMPQDIAEFLPKIFLKIMNQGNKKPKGRVYEQYCTAIPIGTALAQSWNPELCEECGIAVGREMGIFGVHLWLAPAFNIHRSPLCGRNFEYCSEDPLISGIIGAAITKGVQFHKGKGVTIKHFCCNNQETNRYQSNSMVSERALREIYMKNFEICIRESNPKALMSSYNLLNGVHTSESEDLMKTFLRDEMGWNGLIMTDWVIGAMASGKRKYPFSYSEKSIKAGNNIFMPGSKRDYKRVMAALKNNGSGTRLSRSELEYCAAYVAETAITLSEEEKN